MDRKFTRKMNKIKKTQSQLHFGYDELSMADSILFADT